MGLTDTTARNAKPTPKPYKLADSGGLYLAVMPTGGKLWRWKYRLIGKEKLMAFGNYPDIPLAGGVGATLTRGDCSLAVSIQWRDVRRSGPQRCNKARTVLKQTPLCG